MMKDIALTTWSHTSYSDIWPMYFGQIKENADFLKNYLFINELTKESPEWCEEIVNDEKKSFGERVCQSLEFVNESTIIWMQEDFILYDLVNPTDIYNLNHFLNAKDISFIRLMKSGVEGGAFVDESMGLYEVPYNCRYLYSLQATMWKKDHLKRLFEYYNPKNMMDAEVRGSNAAREVNIKGCYVYKKEKKRGNLHYDSSTFPYTSTALYGGSQGKCAMWQTDIYGKELRDLFLKYNIDPNIRGEMQKWEKGHKF